MMIGVALLVFPKLALGLSGFETGVAVMPLVECEGESSAIRLAKRIQNTRKLLLAAAVIMSVFLIVSSLITTVLIPAAEFDERWGGERTALAYLAHKYLGDYLGRSMTSARY